MAKCKNCGELIDWIENENTGKKMPVNREQWCFIPDESSKTRFLYDGERYRGYRTGDADESGYVIGCGVHWDYCEENQTDQNGGIK